MAMTYQVHIGATEPTTNYPGLFWIDPTVSSLYVRTGEWSYMMGGGVISTYTSGLNTLSMIKGITQPASQAVGQLWLNTYSNQIFIYLDDWYPYLAG